MDIFITITQPFVTLTTIAICIAGLILSRSIFIIYWVISLWIVASINIDYYFKMYDQSTVVFANVYCLLFNMFFIMCQFFFFQRYEIKRIRIAEREVHRISSLSVFLAIIGCVCLFFSVPGSASDLLTLNWQEISILRTGGYIIIYNIAFFSIILSCSIIIPYFIYRKHRLNVTIVLINFFIVLIVIKTKALFLPLAFSIVVYIGITRSRWCSWRSLKLGSLFVITLLSFYMLTTIIRYSGSIDDLISSSSSTIIERTSLLMNISVESELINTFYRVVEYFQENETLQGATFTRFILYPISLFIQVDIPDNPMYLYGEITHWGTLGLLRGSNHPTIYGDTFANFGEFGFVFGAIYAVFFGLIWRLALIQKGFGTFSTISGCCYGIPLIMRGSVYYGLYGIFLTSLFGLLITFLLSKKMRQNSHVGFLIRS